MPLFTEINRLKADLDALRPLAPEQEQRVLQKFRLEWNYNSNAIEGNSLTLGETRSLLLHGLTAAGKPMRDHLDIKGHNEAVLWLEDFVRDERPLTEQFIRGMHEVLLGEAYYTPAQTATGQPTRKMIVPGQYKQQPNNVLTATGEMFYFASPEDTPAQMRDLVDWYRQQEAAPTMHPVALAAEFHYRFVRIHPFDDGNGRMSRLLMNLILLRHGYPMTVIKAADRNRYLAALSAADAGDPEPFLRFIIENVEDGLRLMIRAAKGESIEEPNDLDKKLALLKVHLLNSNKTAANAWDLTEQHLFYGQFLSSWIEDFLNQTTRFDFAFFGKTFYANVITLDDDEPANSNSGSLLSLASHLEEKLKANTLLKGLTIYSLWTGFKGLDQPGLALGVRFAFSSRDFEIIYTISDLHGDYRSFKSISFKKHETLLISDYKSDYDIAQISQANYQLANKVYDFIAAKVAEADTPPA